MTAAGRLRLELEDGSPASVLDSDGRLAVLLSAVPFPPGATLRGTSDDAFGPYLLKVRGCRREPSGDGTAPRYRVEGRWVNLSRPQRERLLDGEGDPTAVR